MKQMATVVCHHEYGEPAKVARVERQALAEIQPNEVQVLMKAAPISPADLNALEGVYPGLPPLPAVVGLEGVGVVAQKGIAVADLRVGQLVIRPAAGGHWCEAYTAPAKDLVVVPPGTDLQQASMCTSGVPTAWLMLEKFVSLNRGDWVLQNAANSAVGEAVIQIARVRLLKSINIVRRPEVKEKLLALGATVVLTEEELAQTDMHDVTGGAGVKLGLNAVGGRSAHRLAKAMGEHGTVVTYGAMSREPLAIGNAQLIFRDLAFRGFWITGWYRQASEKDISSMFSQVLPLVRQGRVKLSVEKSYPLAEAAAAIARATEPGRSGKILFEMN